MIDVSSKKRIVLKLGTSTLTHKTGKLNIRRMTNLVRILSDLHNAGKELLLVSSGAVGMGVGKLNLPERPKDTPSKQAAAAVGQCELMHIYDDMFSKYNVTVAQILLTRATLTNERLPHVQNTIGRLLEMGVIPIVNENDTISVSELMFTDNDELSGLIASMMDAQVLIILSNIDGIYNGSPADPASEVIREIEHGKDLSSYIQTSKSSFGRGGMLTKTNIARKVADEGITVIIANGKRDNILVDLLHQELPALFPDVQSSALDSQLTYTRFIPAPQPVSSVKKWIAHSEGFAKGELHIDDCATKVLASDKAVSILPIGITDVRGEFEKDDIVRIIDFEGNPIGVGKANCSSEQAREAMGKHGKKPVVHYDYLYIE